MDVLRCILVQAERNGLTLTDVLSAADYADTLEDWDAALDELALATAQPDPLALLLER